MNIDSFKLNWNRGLMTLALCSGLVAATGANAAPDVYVKETGLGAGLASGSLTLPAPSGTNNWWTGFQTISVASDALGTGATSFLAYCIDPIHLSSGAFLPYVAPATANNVATAFATQATTIQKLFNNYYFGTVSGGNTAANAGAFQLALWEIANDDGNLATGGVQANGSTNATLVSGASAILSSLGGLTLAGNHQYDLTVYLVDRAAEGNANPPGQDYIVATQSSVVMSVPEPETYGMLLAGFGLMGLIARRRRSA
jgi:hypothetical protein